MQDKLTSLSLSKKLYEAGFRGETDYMWCEDLSTKFPVRREKPADWVETPCYPALDLLWDVCIKYAKEIFGDDFPTRWDKKPLNKTEIILELIQQNKIKEAELYIIENSILFKK